jgi:hypothetical protein
MNDYFQSHIISLILTWLFSIPLIIGLVAFIIEILFKKTEGIPRFFMVWLIICMLLFGPLRYILLQIFIAIAYPFQNLHALLTTIILAIYIPIVFCILYAIGLGLPLLGTLAIAGFKESPSKMRLWLSALAAPIIFLVGNYLFYFVLPYAAYSTHWLNAEDVIRATNGPPDYFYRDAVEPLARLKFPHFAEEIGLDKMSAKERLRAHVAVLYLSKIECVYYISKAYPAYFEEVKRKYEMNQQQAKP